jgi:hypothetical protein
MMYPLFDQTCNLKGWLKPNEHIFDENMNWIAYISNNRVWSSDSGNWIGPNNGLLCLDTSGRAILWNLQGEIYSTSRPSRPSRASRASRPTRPSRPSGVWSNLSFEEWLAQ